ncbi:MAG: DDE-type integrase/transposase/recombinase [Chromatiales bacterium]|nr:DDE-type integrase/transposase/recombinase [Chromatiales bacterium]
MLQRRRNARTAKRFFRKLLKDPQRSPNRLVTDKLGSYRTSGPWGRPHGSDTRR